MTHRPDRIAAGPTVTPHLAAGRYFGRVDHQLRAERFTLTHLRHEVGRNLPRHSHQRAYFAIVERGGYADRLDRSPVVCPPGTALFQPAGLVHRDGIAPGGASLLMIEIDDGLVGRAREEGRIPETRYDVRGGELAIVAGRLVRECRGAPARASALVVEGLVLEMLGIVARLGEEAPGRPAWLGRVIDRLHAELDQPHTIERLARDAGVHPVRLSRAFRRHVRAGVGEYLRELRVRWVEERLGGDLSLAELALAAGFADQSHMTRAFRRVTGTTPGAVIAGRRSRPN
jgi:AraC family transcriptional regulator